MNFLKSCRQIYTTFLPGMSIFSTVIGINTGITANKQDEMMELLTTRFTTPTSSCTPFATIIGYTTLGMATGITWPISYPLCASYILFKK